MKLLNSLEQNSLLSLSICLCFKIPTLFCGKNLVTLAVTTGVVMTVSFQSRDFEPFFQSEQITICYL